MDAQIVAALLTVGLTVVAGIVGFLYREYRNRVQPFMAITIVEGDIKDKTSEVDLPISLVNTLKEAFYLTGLSDHERLENVNTCWRETQGFVKHGQDSLESADRLIGAAESGNASEIQSALAKVLSGAVEDGWIRAMLTQGVVIPPSPNLGLPVVVHAYPSNDHDGCVWLDFPRSALWFGSGFDKHRIVKEKCQPLIDLIERLDAKGLAETFKGMKKAVESELRIAKDIGPLLKKTLDENSVWEFEIYLANLGPTPFLVEKEATLHVVDETGAKYDEKCYLVLIDKDGNLSDAQSPLVIGREKDKTFAFFTLSVQGKMKRGQAFREGFDSKSARCSVEFGVQKVGFQRNKQLHTPWAPFRGVS